MEEILVKTSAKLKGSHRVAGEFDRIIGSRPQYAKIEFLVEPAEGFAVGDDVESEVGGTEDERFWKSEHPDWAVLGLLDVLLVAWTQPLRNIKVTVTSADYHPAWSSLMAFRMAGWDAGKKLVEAEKKSKP